MTPLVRLRAPLKGLADGVAEHSLEGATVGDVLARLEGDHPALQGWILDERGALRRHVNVFVNGELGAQDSPVGAEDRIEVIPAISGGR